LAEELHQFLESQPPGVREFFRRARPSIYAVPRPVYEKLAQRGNVIGIALKDSWGICVDDRWIMIPADRPLNANTIQHELAHVISGWLSENEPARQAALERFYEIGRTIFGVVHNAEDRRRLGLTQLARRAPRLKRAIDKLKEARSIVGNRTSDAASWSLALGMTACEEMRDLAERLQLPIKYPAAVVLAYLYFHKRYKLGFNRLPLAMREEEPIAYLAADDSETFNRLLAAYRKRWGDRFPPAYNVLSCSDTRGYREDLERREPVPDWARRLLEAGRVVLSRQAWKRWLSALRRVTAEWAKKS